MASRYYFHLIDERNVIRDDLGAVAADLSEVYRAAVEIIEEFRQEQGSGRRDWNEWKLVVTDDSSRFALVLPLCS